MKWPLSGEKIERFFDTAGCAIGGTGVALALGSYVYFAFAGPNAAYEDFTFAGLSVIATGFIILMTGWKWRAWSFDRANFYRGGLRPATGALWRILRTALWGSFVLLLLHIGQAAIYGLQRADLFITALSLYWSGLLLFGSLYGIHALAFYRYAWEFYHGKHHQHSKPDRRS